MNSIMNKKLKNTIYYCLGIILVGIILQLLSFAKGNEIFFPNILTILKTFFKSIVTIETYTYIGTTLLELLISISISFIIGIILGVFASIFDSFYKILKPLITILRCLPMIILIIILILSVNVSTAPIIATIIVVTPIIYEGTYQGIKTIDRNLIDVYKLHSNTTPKIVFKVFLPLISSHSKASYTNALGMGIKVLITTEYLCGKNNTLGRAIILASQNIEYEKIYAYSLILVILVLLLELVPNLISFLYYKITYLRSKNILNLESIN